MMDRTDTKSMREEINNKSPERASSEESQNSEIKRCFDCGTSKTPLWRGGPAGPKSLCNACGIRSRKKRRAILGIKTEEKKTKKNINNNSSSSNTSSNNGSTTTTTSNSKKMGSPLHQRLIEIGREVLMQRSTVDRQLRKLGEEEQAAVLLMALSCGSVYA